MKANHYKIVFIGSVGLVLILVSTIFATSSTYAAIASPFVGAWYATDWDGSDSRLIIAGSSNGPFTITITDNFISFCDGGPGIIRGNGWLNQENPYLLEADLRLVCFTTGHTDYFQRGFRYFPSTGILFSGMEDGQLIVWHKYGQPVETPPAFDLIVNYRGNWVDGPYDLGHTAWVTVTEGDGLTVKDHTELVTYQWPYWWGATGFATSRDLWDKGVLPDIQPGDWVYAWIDNGASVKVQVGEIGGEIDLDLNSITGTISAGQLSGDVDVQCFRNGMPQTSEEIRYYNNVIPDGIDSYYCSWEDEEWDIQTNDRVGVAYIDEDNNWVINVINAP